MMKRLLSAAALLTLAAGCKGNADRNAMDTSSGTTTPPAAAPAPGGAMRSDTSAGATTQPMSPSSTATPGSSRDSMNRMRDTSSMRDTTGGAAAAKGNQTESGVTNAKTGKSTLGPGIKKTEPTQGQAVTSKGDTLVKPKKP